MYVIRAKDGKISSPVDAEEIKKRIHRGEIKETDDLSLYPNQFALNVKDYPEFEDEFKDVEKTLLYERDVKEQSVHEEKTIVFETPNETDNIKERETTAIGSPGEGTEKELPQVKDPDGVPAPIDEFSDAVSKTQKTVVFERPKALLTRDKAPKSSRAQKEPFSLKF